MRASRSRGGGESSTVKPLRTAWWRMFLMSKSDEDDVGGADEGDDEGASMRLGQVQSKSATGLKAPMRALGVVRGSGAWLRATRSTHRVGVVLDGEKCDGARTESGSVVGVLFVVSASAVGSWGRTDRERSSPAALVGASVGLKRGGDSTVQLDRRGARRVVLGGGGEQGFRRRRGGSSSAST